MAIPLYKIHFLIILGVTEFRLGEVLKSSGPVYFESKAVAHTGPLF